MSGRYGGNIGEGGPKERTWAPLRPATDHEIRRAARHGKKTFLRPDPDEKRDELIRELRQALRD